MDNVITIVSGLPRSGTSMMMRMLEAGGMDVVVDHMREPDIDNPNGYYEFEKVKQIREDGSWLDDFQGKVMKAVSMLLYELPSNKQYKIIFMRRNMEEILASQRKMLERMGKGYEFSAPEMKQLFTRHLEEIEAWLSRQQNMDVMFVDYNEVIANPDGSVKQVNEFLGDKLDTQEMLKVVNKSLYRQRAGQMEGSQSTDDPSKSSTDQTSDEQDKEIIEEQLRELGYME